MSNPLIEKEQNKSFVDWLTGKKEVGEPAQAEQGKPSGMMGDNVEQFYKDLEDFASSGKAMTVQSKGQMTYSKLVEEIQLALEFLGYKLQRFGVDGLFGLETAQAIQKFNEDTKANPVDEAIINFKDFTSHIYEATEPEVTVIDSDLIRRLIVNLKNRNFSQAAIQKHARPQGVTLTSEEDEEFYKAILKGVGANETPEKIKFLKAWRQGEGGKARNNPFNTTKNVNAGGVSNYNSVGVKNYPDRQTGLNATVSTMLLPYYRNLIALLRNDNMTADQLAACPDLHTWGTGDNARNVLASRSINPPPIYA
jgi:peptidoglycan hydrolase-like protein with peptidoglycan-binding domain